MFWSALMLQANKIHSLDFKQKFLYSVVVDQLNKFSKRETMKDLCIEGEIVKHLSVPDWNVIYQIVVIMITTWQKIESTTWKIVWVVAIPLLQKYFELK